MSVPSVSVVVPTYNREQFVSDALASLQSQAGVDAEIIVVNDGSTDGTIDRVRKISAADSRVRLIEIPHGGVTGARNAGVRVACGDYLTFLDSDDLCAPDRLSRQIGKLSRRPDVTAVIGHTRWFENITPDFQRAGPMWFRRTDPVLSSAMFPRTIFDRFGMFDENLDYAEDMDFFFRLFEADVRILVEVEIATYYRMHSGNMTKNEAAMYKGLLRAYHKSIASRRRSGGKRRLNVFFHRPFDEEVVIRGLRDDVVQDAQTRQVW